MVRPLMTPKEVKRRLSAGENPLDLSITHWEINLERWMDRTVDILEDFNNDAIGWRTCALCVSVEIRCRECPYYEYYGFSCTSLHHGDVEEVLLDYKSGIASRQDVIEATRKMVDSLKEIANDRNTQCNTET